MGRVQGKVAIVTGAAQGQGAAEAKLLAAEGAKVLVTDILDDMGKAVAGEINASGGTAEFAHLDISDEPNWQSVVGHVVSTWGQLDILINNAAIWMGEGGVADITVDEWDKMFNINAKGAFLGTKTAIGAMKQSGGGSIINVATTNALQGGNSASAYGASKAAVVNMSRSAAKQCGGTNIRVNVIHPGPIDTEMLRGGAPGILDTLRETLPMRRLGQPEDIANGALYLASDEASFVTGSELIIDGGLRV